MDPEALKNLSPQQQQEIIQQVQQQVALANMQELLQKVTDKCFKKCITSPGSSMSSSDNKCVSLCMDRSVKCICSLEIQTLTTTCNVKGTWTHSTWCRKPTRGNCSRCRACEDGDDQGSDLIGASQSLPGYERYIQTFTF